MSIPTPAGVARAPRRALAGGEVDQKIRTERGGQGGAPLGVPPPLGERGGHNPMLSKIFLQNAGGNFLQNGSNFFFQNFKRIFLRKKKFQPKKITSSLSSSPSARRRNRHSRRFSLRARQFSGTVPSARSTPIAVWQFSPAREGRPASPGA